MVYKKIVTNEKTISLSAGYGAIRESFLLRYYVTGEEEELQQ
jgi:hypothetical protein